MSAPSVPSAPLSALQPAPMPEPTVHGTLVALIPGFGATGAAAIGVLLRGPPGSGKSDLALRLIDARQARLVADDRVVLRMAANRLMGSVPPSLAGLLEIRGIGIVRLPATQRWEGAIALGLVVDLVPAAAIERLPPSPQPCPQLVEEFGACVPRLTLNPFEASALAKLAVAASLVCGILRSEE